MDPSCHGYISISLYIYIYIYIHLSWKSTHKHFHAMECFQIHNLEPCHARVSKILFLVRFRIFEPYQSSKNNIQKLKSSEKQWQAIKHSKNHWKNEKYNKNNETYGQISAQWKASKYIIWSHVTPRSRKYSILSVFEFLRIFEPYQSSKNNIKKMKSNEQQWKRNEK